MSTFQANPTILLVTPEVTYLPKGMGDIADNLSAKAGGLADVSATLISALFEEGADIHVAVARLSKYVRRRHCTSSNQEAGCHSARKCPLNEFTWPKTALFFI